MNMNDAVVIYGKKKPIDKRSIHLFDALLDGMIDQHDIFKTMDWKSRRAASLICRWLQQNEVAEDDVMFYYFSFKRMHTYDTTAKFYLQLNRDEHRTLFLLCKDNIMDTTEKSVA